MSLRQIIKSGVNAVVEPLGLRISGSRTFSRLMEIHQQWHDRGALNMERRQSSPLENFLSVETLRLTKRRQEHLESLGLQLAGRTVLEVGAGIGDHTTYFLDRGCRVLSTEGRSENLIAFRQRYDQFAHYPERDRLEIAELDLDAPPENSCRAFEVIYCYGVLYHLRDPLAALRFLAKSCTELLLVETSVALDRGETVIHATENSDIVSQSIHGAGCHPSRLWMWNRLRELFEHVYVPVTQPWHEQFPLDWVNPVPTPGVAQRAVFIGSRQALDNQMLMEGLPDRQVRH